ncbi:hypothetical protein DSECCO2_574100 [anaerobic digester metagenome]
MRAFLGFVLLFISAIAFCQSPNDIWYFGENAGISFSAAPPFALTNGALNTGEGCATICDNSGQLLFYTDGMTIYNKNHQPMANGTGLFGNISSTHSAIIVPLPGSTTLYYVFTLDAFAGVHGACYTIVDMTLNSGFGDVAVKNQTILTPASEKVTVVKHSNNTDFWVIIHGWGNNSFHSYLLTASGLNATPVTTSIGTIYSGGGGINNASNAIGYMKVNSAGNMIAVAICVDDVRELFQFDNSTGVLSNPITIADPDNSSTSRAYAMEFSPDNHYLYVKNFYSHNVYQYDVSNYNQTAVENSKTLAGTVSGASIYFTGAMQLGPDDKIYIVEFDTPFLAVINNPNNPAATCGLVDNAISLNGRNGELGLPCLVNKSFMNNQVSVNSSGCYNNIYSFTLSDTSNIVSVNWNFDDPASGANNASGVFNPTHLFSSPGTYDVSVVIVFNGGACDTLFHSTTPISEPPLLQEDTVQICSGSDYTVAVQGTWLSYLWNTGASIPALTLTQQGLYVVSVTDNNGCVVDDSVICELTTSLNNQIDTAFCEGTFIDFDGQTISAAGDYLFQYVSTSGCDSIVTLHAEVTGTPAVELPEDTTICEGEQFLIHPVMSGQWNSCLWSDGNTNPDRIITEEGLYSIVVLGDCGNSEDAVFVAFDSCISTIWFPNVFTPNGDYHNPVFTGIGTNIFDFHLMIFNRWGQFLYETDSMYEGWDGNFKGRECPEGVYFWVADYGMYNQNEIVNENSRGSVTLIR